MNLRALVLAIIGVVVAAFYGLESVLSYKASGVSGPTLVKVLICAIGVYFFLRNAARVKKADENNVGNAST